MKSFIYTFTEKRKQPACVYTVRIYQIVRGVPVFRGERSESYVSEFQLVLLCMQQFKMVPKKAFERHEPSNNMKLAYPDDAHRSGLFRITKVS